MIVLLKKKKIIIIIIDGATKFNVLVLKLVSPNNARDI